MRCGRRRTREYLEPRSLSVKFRTLIASPHSLPVPALITNPYSNPPWTRTGSALKVSGVWPGGAGVGEARAEKLTRSRDQDPYCLTLFIPYPCAAQLSTRRSPGGELDCQHNNPPERRGGGIRHTEKDPGLHTWRSTRSHMTELCAVAARSKRLKRDGTNCVRTHTCTVTPASTKVPQKRPGRQLPNAREANQPPGHMSSSMRVQHTATRTPVIHHS